jgi:hypothetical protein
MVLLLRRGNTSVFSQATSNPPNARVQPFDISRPRLVGRERSGADPATVGVTSFGVFFIDIRPTLSRVANDQAGVNSLPTSIRARPGGLLPIPSIIERELLV